MINVLLALAGLALVSAPLDGADLAAPKAQAGKTSAPAKPAKAKPAAAKPADSAGVIAEAAKPEKPPMSAAAARVANWVLVTGDNRALPYLIIDKQGAVAHLFDAEGKAVADAPVLIGVAPGDDASPGIGSKSLAEIGPAEKTTPAGRFLARFGVAAGKKRVLWVDYATSVALHTIPPGTKKERRRERMLSPEIDDNRITFGCINVPIAFYGKNLQPLFSGKGGYVYVLPDTKSLEEVFPPLRVQQFSA